MKKVSSSVVALTFALLTLNVGQAVAEAKELTTPSIGHTGPWLASKSKPKPQPCGGIKKINLVSYQHQRDDGKPSSIRNPTKCKVTVQVYMNVSIFLLDKDYGRLNICTPRSNGLCWGQWYTGTQDYKVVIGPKKTVTVTQNQASLTDIVMRFEQQRGMSWSWQSQLDGFSTRVLKVSN